MGTFGRGTDLRAVGVWNNQRSIWEYRGRVWAGKANLRVTERSAG